MKKPFRRERNAVTEAVILGRDELAFLIQVLNVINLNGQPAQLEAALVLRRGIVEKLERAYGRLPAPPPQPNGGSPQPAPEAVNA